jgi:hypothetical protein
MIDWNIQSRAHVCQACQKPFADKETFHTLLFDQKSGYDRLDICEQCWKSQYQEATSRKGFISYWQSVYCVPPAAPPEAIQKETAESLLRKLVEQNLPDHEAARFILEHGKSGDLFKITDPDLQLDQLEKVQRDVAYLLEHGLNPSAAAPPEATQSEMTPASDQPPQEPEPSTASDTSSGA